MKIQFCNFWPGLDKYNYFEKFLKCNISKHIELSDSSECDILISSCLGPLSNVNKYKSKIKILFIGEPDSHKQYLSNEKLLMNTFDMILGFKYTNKQKKLFRFPLWLCYYRYYNIHNPKDNILTYIQAQHEKHSKLKKENVSLVSRHDRGGQRRILLNECKNTLM